MVELRLSELREYLKFNHDGLSQRAGIYVKSWQKVLEREYQTTDLEKLARYSEEQISFRNEIFPEGQIVIFDADEKKILGGISAIRKTFSHPMDIREKYLKLTGNGRFSTHQSDGNHLLCVAVEVDPNAPRGLCKFLVQAELELADRSGIEYRLAFSRAEGLNRYYNGKTISVSAPKYSSGQLLFYLGLLGLSKPMVKGEKRNVFDHSLSIHLGNGAHPVLDAKGLPVFIENSRPADWDGGGYNVLMQYDQGTKIVDLGELEKLGKLDEGNNNPASQGR